MSKTQEMKLKMKVQVDKEGFLEKAKAVADARRALDEALDNLENHITGHVAVEPVKAESQLFDIYKDDFFDHGEQEMFEKVEKALGFKLFFWQKYYILTGVFRRYGETTAKILRELLEYRNSDPIDNSEQNSHHRTLYLNEMYEIQKRLEENGIPTRKVLWTKEEKREYYRARKSINAGNCR